MEWGRLLAHVAWINTAVPAHSAHSGVPRVLAAQRSRIGDMLTTREPGRTAVQYLSRFRSCRILTSRVEKRGAEVKWAEILRSTFRSQILDFRARSFRSCLDTVARKAVGPSWSLVLKKRCQKMQYHTLHGFFPFFAPSLFETNSRCRGGWFEGAKKC